MAASGYLGRMVTKARPRQLPSGNVTWRVQFRAEGKVTSESFRDASEAAKFAKLVDRVGGEAAMQTRELRDDPIREVPTLEEWTAAYLDPNSGHLTGVTEATRNGYRQIADRSFLQVLGPMPLTLITKREVAKWVQWQEAQPSRYRAGQTLSAKTMRNYHGVLSSLLAAAAEEGIITGNTARGTRLTRGLRQGVTFLTRDEFELVSALMPAYYRPLATWLVHSGMRWGEATALTWGDLNRKSVPPTARVTKAWKKGVGGKPVLGPPKTARSVRTIVMLADVIELLGAPGPGDALIFTGVKGNRLWSERFHKAAWGPAVAAANDPEVAARLGYEALGKQPRVHDLRHSHASWLIADGAPLTYVQHRLGHENVATTSDIYGHLLPDANQQLAAIMSGWRQPAPQLELT